MVCRVMTQYCSNMPLFITRCETQKNICWAQRETRPLYFSLMRGRCCRCRTSACKRVCLLCVCVLVGGTSCEETAERAERWAGCECGHAFNELRARVEGERLADMRREKEGGKMENFSLEYLSHCFNIHPMQRLIHSVSCHWPLPNFSLLWGKCHFVRVCACFSLPTKREIIKNAQCFFYWDITFACSCSVNRLSDESKERRRQTERLWQRRRSLLMPFNCN